jgi:hypothetical protein
MILCLLDLVELTGGELRLAAMPPRDGELTQVRRLVLSAEAASMGDVFWCLARRAGEIELAFLNGALGIVAAGPTVEPWPGRFSLQIDDPIMGLGRLIDSLLADRELSFDSGPELKDLQLYAAGLADISPPTCGRSAKGDLPGRCRRQAA